MADLQNMNALIQFTVGEGKVWDGLESPVPEGMWIYDNTNQVIVEGDGVTLFESLSPIFDFNKLSDTATFAETHFPQNLNGYNSRILKVSSSGDKFEISTINIESLLDSVYMNTELAKYATKSHNHNDIYLTKQDDILAFDKISSMTIPEADIISYLALKALDEDARIASKLEYSFMDEFATAENIDSVLSGEYTLTSGVIVNNLNTTLQLTSLPIEVNTSVERVDVLIRSTIPPEKITNNIVTLELSRDNGTTWVSGNLTCSPLSAGDINIYVGTCQFGESPEGTSIRWRITSVEDTTMSISGIRLRW
jgi:hypothetical protein